MSKTAIATNLATASYVSSYNFSRDAGGWLWTAVDGSGRQWTGVAENVGISRLCEYSHGRRWTPMDTTRYFAPAPAIARSEPSCLRQRGWSPGPVISTTACWLRD